MSDLISRKRGGGGAGDWNGAVPPESGTKRLKEGLPDTHNMNPNPLLIDLVLENLFSRISDCSEVKNFRLVSRRWDVKLGKVLMAKTEIDVSKLIEPYPEGLGWSEETDENGEWRSFYDSPYPVHQFENIKINGTCALFKDPRVIRWFEKMGSTVKKLHFNAQLNCYHHTRFLECVLKIWCQNLNSLHLDGITWYTGLSHYSRFDGNPFICTLKELVITGEPESGHETAGDCWVNLTETYLNYDNSSEKRVNILDRSPSLISQIESLFQRILQVIAGEPVGHPQASGLVSRIDTRLGTDGGVMAQIMEHLGTEKVLIKNLPSEHCDAFLLSLTRRPKRLIETLKDFEYGNFTMFMWCWQLDSFRKLKFPLTKICFGPVAASISPSNVKALLKSVADTLQHLEFDGSVTIQDLDTNNEPDYLTLKIPYLPHLKTFKNRNIFCTRTGSLDFVKRLPNLEHLYLENAVYHSSFYPLDPSEVFNLIFQTSCFENGETHPLKELELVGKISFTRHVELLRTWFPQLKKLTVTLEGSDVFVEFLQAFKNSDLEDLKISFYSNDNEWCNIGICNHFIDLKNLRYVELIHLSDSPLRISTMTCVQGFARAPKLSSLKLENVAMYLDEEDGIRAALSHISYVKLSECVFQQRPVNVEFGNGKHDPPRRAIRIRME